MQRVLPLQSDRIVSDRLFWEVLLKDDWSQRLEEQAERKSSPISRSTVLGVSSRPSMFDQSKRDVAYGLINSAGRPIVETAFRIPVSQVSCNAHPNDV